MLQGNIVPNSMFIDSWTQGPIATHMAGDPAMTVVPNLPITGVLGGVVSVSLTILTGIADDLQSEKRVAVRSAEVRDG